MALTFLIDSNVLFSLEPFEAPSATDPVDGAVRFYRLATENGHRLIVGAGSHRDIDRATGDRREHRRAVVQKYSSLAGIPIPASFASGFNLSNPNDEVDAELVAALAADAAHYLVTEDHRLARRAERVVPGIGDRIITIVEAAELLDALHPEALAPPPHVDRVRCHELDESDPIFESLRLDYSEFDEWFRRCKQEQRDAFVIRDAQTNRLAGVCLLKDEDDAEHGLPRPRIKLATFKVAAEYRGQRYGEQLLKAALLDAEARARRAIYLTVFDRHDDLLRLLTDLGFEDSGSRTDLGEHVWVRHVDPSRAESNGLDAFEVNRRFGPSALALDSRMFLVPIQPRWEERLFPEGVPDDRATLFDDLAPCGSGLRKAYLCCSGIRSLQRGDILLFYRSKAAGGRIDPTSVEDQAVRFVCVVEDSLASRDPDQLTSFAGSRTVYTQQEIARMTENGRRDVLAIRMRQSRQVEGHTWRLEALVQRGIIARAPQSIQQVATGFPSELVRADLRS